VSHYQEITPTLPEGIDRRAHQGMISSDLGARMLQTAELPGSFVARGSYALLFRSSLAGVLGATRYAQKRASQPTLCAKRNNPIICALCG